MSVTTVPPSSPGPSLHSQRGLDWLNFFVADVQTGFGPFLAVYLTIHGWYQGAIGSVLTISTILGVLSQTPAGALVDWTRRKRTVIAAGLAMIAAGAVIIALLPAYPTVMAGEILHGITGGALRSAIAGIGLGLVGHRAYSGRVGRNHRFDSLGNALTAAAMGGIGYLVSARAPFFVAAGLCVPAALALRWIRPQEIDYARARGASRRQRAQAAQWRAVLKDRRLLVFAACMFLFQFADASILLLGAERLAAHYKYESELVTSAMVVVPQLVTAAIALWIARRADDWGRKPLLMAGFLAVLTRTVLFAVVPGEWFLVAVQTLDGLTAAVIGIMVPLVVADLTRGTGRYNAMLGVIGTAGMVGASASTSAAGFLAQAVGFGAGFAALAAAALAGLGLLWRCLPETVPIAMQDDDT